MSWAITINDLDVTGELPDEIYEKAAKDNPEYEHDARLAFELAKSAGLVSATISGGRTPSPYGGPDTVTISVVGFNNHNQGHAVPRPQGRDFNAAVLDNIYAGAYDNDRLEDDQYPGGWHAPYESECQAPQDGNPVK